MKWRKISEEEIDLTLTAPDKVEPSERNRFNAYKNIKGRLLRVTYLKEEDQQRIITAAWKGE